MIGFWISAVVILAATLAVLLRVMLRGRGGSAAAGGELAVYRDQLAEVERDLERGVLAEDQADAARLEIKRRILAASEADTAAAAAARPVPPTLRGAALTAIGLLLPVGSLGLYLVLGSPTVPDQPLSARQSAAPAVAGERNEMAELTDRLAAQLEKDPSRPDGWLLLGRSYRTIEKYAKAADAFLRALDLTDRDPNILSEYGELLMLAHAGQVSEPALAAFREARDRDPTEPLARFYLGVARAQQGDALAALQEWIDLIAVSPAGAPWLADVQARIREVAAETGIDVASITPSAGLPPPPAPPEMAGGTPGMTPVPSVPPSVPPAGTAALPAPSAEDVKAASEMTAEDRQEMIRSMVEGLAARLEDEPDAAVGWRRLARAYQVLGEAEKAEEALARAEAAEKKAP